MNSKLASRQRGVELIGDETGKRLHQRLSSGEGSTATEHEQLTAWNAAQDAAEADSLKQPEIKVDLSALQRQVDAASDQLATITYRIHHVTVENNALRKQIKHWRQQLASNETSCMSKSQDLRDEVRRRAGFACDSCGILETDAVGQLTIDNCQPRSKGGDNNLLCSCVRCNLYKQDN